MFDFSTVTAPFRMQPGLRRIGAGSTQLTPNRAGSAALAEKVEVLTHAAPQALLAASDFDARPALHALARHAAAEQPAAFRWDGAELYEAPWLGWSLQRGRPLRLDGAAAIGSCLEALAPEWRLAALLSLAFAEDFAVIDASTGRIPWLAVCLPSHWAPEDKVGRHFAEVHAPVADNRLLVTAADHLARLVTGSARWERFVWTITRHSRLDSHPQRSHPAPWPAGAGADAVAAVAYFRTERQTFVPLPELRQAVFTIHVERQPLADAIDTPARAAQLHAALASMSDAVLAYRGLAEAQPRLLDWLARRAADFV